MSAAFNHKPDQLIIRPMFPAQPQFVIQEEAIVYPKSRAINPITLGFFDGIVANSEAGALCMPESISARERQAKIRCSLFGATSVFLSPEGICCGGYGIVRPHLEIPRNVRATDRMVWGPLLEMIVLPKKDQGLMIPQINLLRESGVLKLPAEIEKMNQAVQFRITQPYPALALLALDNFERPSEEALVVMKTQALLTATLNTFSKVIMV